MARNAVLYIKVTHEMHDRLKELAIRDRTSMSAIVVATLEDLLHRRARLAREPKQGPAPAADGWDWRQPR